MSKKKVVPEELGSKNNFNRPWFLKAGFENFFFLIYLE